MVMYFIDRRSRITDQLQVCHDTLTCVPVHNWHWGGGGYERLNSAIDRIGIFQKGKKAMTPGILNTQVLKSDFNSKMLNFNFGFTSYWTCLEITIPSDSAFRSVGQ